MGESQETFGQTEGRKDGQTLFYRTLPAEAGGPNIFKNITSPKRHFTNISVTNIFQVWTIFCLNEQLQKQPSKVICKKSVLKNLANFPSKTPVLEVFSAQVFSCEIYRVFKNICKRLLLQFTLKCLWYNLPIILFHGIASSSQKYLRL